MKRIEKFLAKHMRKSNAEILLENLNDSNKLNHFTILGDYHEVRQLQDADALIWQGHMLDLLDRRHEAVGVYQQVVEMKTRRADATTTVDCYGLEYIPRIYAKDRMKSPFKRIENLRED